MNAVATIFDMNGDGFIDYYEFVSALHPNRDPLRRSADADQIQDEVNRQVAQCNCAKRFQVEQISANRYRVSAKLGSDTCASPVPCVVPVCQDREGAHPRAHTGLLQCPCARAARGHIPVPIQGSCSGRVPGQGRGTSPFPYRGPAVAVCQGREGAHPHSHTGLLQCLCARAGRGHIPMPIQGSCSARVPGQGEGTSPCPCRGPAVPVCQGREGAHSHTGVLQWPCARAARGHIPMPVCQGREGAHTRAGLLQCPCARVGRGHIPVS
uniref:EF-hand domain-containing protein n=1 Tax=Junco hyemalis TaxID=40217 RepID=A0A8C5J4P2_JUNHY